MGGGGAWGTSCRIGLGLEVCPSPCLPPPYILLHRPHPKITSQGADVKELMLKILFNILEAAFRIIVELWCLCCMMMFRWVNKQPGIQMFWNLCCHSKDINDWISPLNKRSGLLFILARQFMEERTTGKSGHLSIFTFLKHFMMLLKCNVFRASFLHLTKDTGSIRVGIYSSDFKKWKHC